MVYVFFYVDLGGIKDFYQFEYFFQDVFDGVWWGFERADFGQ